jgi:hypothetical protein
MSYNPIVNITAVNGVAPLTGNGVTGTGSIRVTIASDNSNVPVNNAQVNGVTMLTGNGVAGTGAQRVTIASDNTPFPVKIDHTPFGVIQTPATPTPSNINSAASTNATSVKGSAGTLYGITCSNGGAAAAFVKLYNKATAPTVGTDTPVLTIPIPASGVVTLNLGELGHRFSTGIALAITNLVADSDATAVAANQVKVLLDYI